MLKSRFIKNIIMPLIFLSFIALIVTLFFIYFDNSNNIDTNDHYQEGNSINMVYMESPEVTVGGSERVCFSFKDNVPSEETKLVYHKKDSDMQYVEPSKVDNELALFEIPFTNESEVGKYDLDMISWEGKNPGSQVLEASDKGYSFAVSKIPDDFIPDYSDNLYDINEDGSLTRSDNTDLSKNQMFFSANAKNLSAQQNGLTICLDPGHGGNESGACYGGWREADINLNIAWACYNQLSKYPGVNVIMTRYDNYDVSLNDRAIIAANNGANLFVSLHCNSSGGPAYGAEVYIPYVCGWRDDLSSIGNSVAQKIMNNFLTRLGLGSHGDPIKTKQYTPDDGVTYEYYPGGIVADHYSVIRNNRINNIPAIIVEHAFINSQLDFLVNNSTNLGVCDAQAIAEYYGLGMYGPSDILSGTYKISTTLSDKKVLDVKEESFLNEAKLVMIDDNSSLSQRWKVESSDNEWVTIQNMNSGKYLDIYGGIASDCIPVQQYEANNADNQKWKIIKVDKGYKLVSKLNCSFVLDIPYSSLDPDNTLEIFTDYQTDNQIFDFIIDIPGSDDDVEDGYYRISSVENTSMVLDVVQSSLSDGAYIQTFNKHEEWPNQIFKIEKYGKYHKIKNIVTDKVLEVWGSSTKVGLRLEQWKDNSTINQLWSLRKNASGKYCFYSACNGQVFDCRSGKALSENPVDLFNFHGGDNQLWNMDLFSYDINNYLDALAQNHKNDVADGLYSIQSFNSSSYVLDLYNGSKENCANVQMFNNFDTSNQHWYIKHIDDTGYVSIINENSMLVLDVEASKKVHCTNVEQFKNNNTLNQKWICIKNADGSFTIQSAMIPMLYLTVASSYPINETNVNVSYTQKDGSQFFYLQKLDTDVPFSNPDFKTGFYRIKSKSNNNFVLDLACSSLSDNASYILWDNNDEYMNQVYEIVKVDDYHKIKNVVSGKYLTSLPDFGDEVVQKSSSSSKGQLWSVQVSDGVYTFINVRTGRELCSESDSIKSGKKIITTNKDSFLSRYWQLFETVDPVKSLDDLAMKNKDTISDGLYCIKNLAGSNLSLDVYSGSVMPGANIQLFSYFNTANQKWYIKNLNDGYVSIVNEKSGYYLDIDSSKKANNTNVCQFNCTENPNQKWIIIKDGNTYKIMSALMMNLNLSAEFAPAGDETNIVVSYGGNKLAQSFAFEKADPSPPTPESGTLICHQPRTNVEKMINYFNSSGATYPSYYKDHGYGCDTLWDFCNTIIEESIFEGVDPCVTFCQAMKETGWLKFNGLVNIEQCNFCGLGATGPGNPGHSFNNHGNQSVRFGIRAQVQHLKVYANGHINRDEWPYTDPRWDKPAPGCAPTVEQLGGRWATGKNYGYEIVAMMQNCY